MTPARRRWREDTRGSMSNNNGNLPDHIKSVLWKLAYKQLDSGDWKKLALHWAFNHDQINAIEHQYTGKQQEHSTTSRLSILNCLKVCSLNKFFNSKLSI